MFESSMSRRALIGRGVLLGGATLAAPALLAACGTPESGTQSAAGATSAPRRGGTLRMAFASSSADPADPLHTTDMLGMVRSMLVYEQLGTVLGDGTVQGILYDEFTPNDDATQWTLRLKEGVTFADGRPLTAQDVLASFSAYEGTEAGAATALIDVAGSTADELTATVALVSPIADLDYRLAKAYFVILPAGQTATTAEQLNGSGAYRVDTFAPGQRSILVRRDDYWGGHDVWFPDRIELVSVPDPASRMNALLTGQVDFADDISFVDAAAQRENPAVTVVESAAPAGLAWFLNCTIEPFSDVRVRQAFRLAVDRQALVDATLHGFGEPGNDLWGAGYPWYNDQLDQRTQDLDGARELLAQAGVDRVALRFITSPVGPGLVESTQLMAQQVAEAGFDVTVEEIPPDAYWSDTQAWYSYAGVAFSTVYPFVDMAPLTYLAESPYNFGWQRPEWEATYHEAAGILEEGRRAEVYDQLQQQLWEEGPDLVWGLAARLVATSGAVGGADTIPDIQMPHLAGVWMNE